MGKRKGRREVESICWSCEDARPKRCAWVDGLKPVWDKAYRKTVAKGQVLHVVQQCEHYRGKGEDVPGLRGKASA